MSGVDFVHLRVRSEYSMVDGLANMADLAGGAASLGMWAVGLTDQCNLFGLIKFHNACLKQKIKPLLGADLLHHVEGAEAKLRLTVLVCSLAGYRNLLRLVSSAYTGTEHRAAVTTETIMQYSEGLIVLAGARDTEIGQALLRGDLQAAEQAVKRLATSFPGRLYLEVQRTGRADEETCLRAAVELAPRLDLALVATNDVRFLKAEDYETHETRVCINDGRVVHDSRRPRHYSAEQYLKPAEAMIELFADLPEAVANASEIAKRCTVELDLGRSRLPDYPVPQGETLVGFLERRAGDGLNARIEAIKRNGAYAIDEQAYQDRLAYELGVISETAFPGYFLIVMEFVAWAKERGIPVGPGRGSGSGSLVAYALGITDLDPVHYNLLFERFLNPERISMPDFDVDFCVEGRDQVIQHVSELYGVEAVSQIATFGSMAAKAVVRDVTRAQGKPYALGDKLSKLIPNRLGVTLATAIAESGELKSFVETDEEAGEVMDMARKLEGVIRNVGRHAGGVVIAPSKLTDFTPLYVDERSGSLISQYDKDDVERAGLVKFDFLGLTTLTIIAWAVEAANGSIRVRGGGPDELIDIGRLPLDDQETYDLLNRIETVGVFQLESVGMKGLIERLKPDSIDDIIALVALFRPGPLQNGADKDYIERKYGRAKTSYPHTDLEPVLKSTFGVVIYQEQVMQIAQVLAGFSLGQADILRKAMGKKDADEMAKMRGQFLEGAAAHDVDAKLASNLFDQMASFAGYAFNKAHAATYALIAYQTAWLKTHHPAEFMAATLSADMDNIDKVVTLIDEVRRMKLRLVPPNVNRSEFRFLGAGDEVVYGLGAVRGVGRAPVESIIQARHAGPFVSLSDFCLRVDVKRANKRVIEALIQAGAMDPFAAEGEQPGAVRARLFAELEQALQTADQASRDEVLGMNDLFGGVVDEKPAVATTRPLSYGKRLEMEKTALGLYLTGHPIQPYLAEFKGKCRRLAEVQVADAAQWVAGLVTSLRRIRGRNGRDMEVLVLDDRSARLEVVLYADVCERERPKLEKGRILVLEGEVQADNYNGSNGRRMRAERILTIEEWRQRARLDLRIDLGEEDDAAADLPSRLAAALEPYRVAKGGCGVTVGCRAGGVAGSIRLGWRVRASEALTMELKAEFGDERVVVGAGGASGGS